MTADHLRGGAVSDGRRSSAAARVAVASLTALLAAPLAAQDSRVGIPVGEAELYPEIRIEYVADDNVFIESDEPVDGSAVIVSPRVELIADRRLLTLRGEYAGEYSQGDPDVLDVADHRLGLDVAAELDKRRRLSGSVVYLRDHQQIGESLTQGRGAEFGEPVIFDQLSAVARFRYGVADARGNLEAGVSADVRSYASLEAITDGRDFTLVEPYGLFSYRLGGDTRALLELRYGAFSDDAGIDERGELSLFGGAEFSATGRLRGIARLGFTSADYRNVLREDTTIFAAQTAVEYLLREYITLTLTFDRQLDDATTRFGGTGVQAITDELRLGWRQTWSSRLSHDAFVSRATTTDPCPAGDVTRIEAGIELDYAVRRWLSFGASARASNRDREVCPEDDATSNIDYDRTRLGVHVRVTL